MSNYNFGLTSSADFMYQLLEEHIEFVKNPLSERMAINCAIRSWHLAEWIYAEDFNSRSNFENLYSFQRYIKSLCVSLGYMQDLTNGSKHTKITKYVPQVKDSEKHLGAFSSAFSFEFDTSQLIIVLNDGTRLNFASEIKKSIGFWKTFFHSEFNITIN